MAVHSPTRLVELAKHGSTDSVRRASDAGLTAAQVNEIDEATGTTALIKASMKGQDGMVELLLGLGADINKKDKKGNTALLVASRSNYSSTVRVVELLLEHKDTAGKLLITDVDQRNQYGDTALMWACEYGHTQVAEMLLKRGAKVNEKDRYGLTALIAASAHGITEVVDLLLKPEWKT